MSDTIDTAAPVKKQRPGTFSATYQPKHRRTADRIPHNVKADVVAGLAAHGEDGKGKGGLRGYIKYLAGKYPKQAARLIERLLPPSVVVANASSSGAQINAVNIVSIPTGTFLSSEDIQKFQSGTMRLEHAPLQQLEQLEPLEHFESIEHPASSIDQASLQDDQEFTPRTENSPQIERIPEPEISNCAQEIAPESEARLLAVLSTSIEALARRAGVSLDDK